MPQPCAISLALYITLTPNSKTCHKGAEEPAYLPATARRCAMPVELGVYLTRRYPTLESEPPQCVPGAMEHWPALARWQDPAYLLAAAGPRTVPVELGAHYLAPGWGQQLMPFSAFVAAHLLGGRPDPGAGARRRPGPGRGHPELNPDSTAEGLGTPDRGCSGPRGRDDAAAGPACSGGSGTAGGGGRGGALAAPRGYLAQHDLFAQVGPL